MEYVTGYVHQMITKMKVVTACHRTATVGGYYIYPCISSRFVLSVVLLCAVFLFYMALSLYLQLTQY